MYVIERETALKVNRHIFQQGKFVRSFSCLFKYCIYIECFLYCCHEHCNCHKMPW